MDHTTVALGADTLIKSLANEYRLRLKTYKKELREALVSALSADTVTTIISQDDVEKAREELSITLDSILCDQRWAHLGESDKALIKTAVLNHIVGLGPLEDLMQDPEVTEIMVNGCSSLFYEKQGVLHQSEACFDTPDEIMLVIDKILAPLGKRVDELNPLVNARLQNGDRINAVIQPIGLEGPYITIRRFTGRITSLQRLQELGSLPQWYAQLLSLAVRMRQDIAVAGGTGSGKTTLLNALSQEIPKGERIVTIEDSAELSFKEHPHVVRLEARQASIEGTGEIRIRDLVINALRMRPDRIIVGEVRGEEAIDMLQAMNTGHDGSLTTLHAGNELEAISRLVLMARYGMDLPAHLIEEQIATALNLVVMSKRIAGGGRRITSLSEVSRTDDGGVHLIPCVTYDEVCDRWRLSRLPSFTRHALDGDAQHVAEVSESYKRYTQTIERAA